MQRPASPYRLVTLTLLALAAAATFPSSGPLTARAVELLAPVEILQDPALVPLAQTPGTARRTRLAAIATTALPSRNTLDLPGVAGGVIRLDLFDDVSVVAVHERFDPNARGVTWVGRVQGVPESSVTLVYGADGLLTGSIASRDALYSIRPASETFRQANPIANGQLHVVTEVDQAQFPQESQPIEVNIPESLRRAADALPQNDSADFIDVMVVWSTAAQALAGGASAIQNLITLGVTESNTSYGNSGVVQRIRLAHMEAVPYTDSGDHTTDLTNFRNAAGVFSGIPALRDTHKADLVMLLVGDYGGACGIAYVMSNPSAAFESNGYSVVSANCISPNYSFAHELGHNMGLRHDWYMDSAITPSTYAHAHVHTGASNRFRTVMGYNNICSAQGFNCTRVLYWSNPSVMFNGAVPMGIPAGTNSSCTVGSLTANTCDAFDAQVLNETASIVANFRQAGPPPPGAFSKVAPANGAAGVPASTTLSWQAASGAVSYRSCYDTTDDAACAGVWTNVAAALSVNISSLVVKTVYFWQVRAINADGTTAANSGVWWSFATPGFAVFDPTLQAPKCAGVSNDCDTGSGLIRGTDTMALGAEPNQPNTINDSCSDGTSGVFHQDESIDRLRIFTVDTQPFAASKTVTIQATTWIFDAADDKLDLYYTANASSPAWTLIATLTPGGTGQQVLSTNYVLPAGNLQAIRARLRWNGVASPCETVSPSGYDDYDDVVFAVTPAPSTNFALNGSFASGTTNWSTFATPDSSYMVSNTSGNVFQFYRQVPPAGTSNQAVVFQNTGTSLPSGAPMEASFMLGNSDTVNRKRVSVLMHDSDFSDLSVCTFWLPPNWPLALYRMRAHTTKVWVNTTISFYAASANGAGNTTGFYRLDDVQVVYAPALSSTRTDCIDPIAPPPPGGAPSSNLVANGDFTGGLASWTLYGQINGAVNSGVFEFIRIPGDPAGVILQSTGQTMTANQLMTATFQLGNSSAVRKRVTVILHDSNFSDLSACTFWLAPGQPLGNYEYRAFATQAWANATFSVYGATVGAEPYMRLDNVTFQRTPAQGTVGTECIEPSSGDQAAAYGAAYGAQGLQPLRPVAGARAPALQELQEPALKESTPAAFDRFVANGFSTLPDAGAGGSGAAWVATADTNGIRTLELADPLDLSAAGARLTFSSWLTATNSRARVEVSIDGISWETVFVASPSDTWVPTDVDLAAYIGFAVNVRFVFDGAAPEDGSAPDVWRVAMR